MAGRFDGPYRATGDVNPSLEQRNTARKLLGYMVNMHKLGGPSSNVLRARLADGSTVTARLVDGMPMADFTPGSNPKPSKLTVGLLAGFVTKPRNNGTFGASDGQNAFGVYAHVLLNGKAGDTPSDPVAWSTAYLDTTYLPVDAPEKFYSTNPDANAVFPDGLLGITNTHWKDATENMCLSWYGSREQAGQGSVTFDFGPELYRNGQVIISGGLNLNFGIAAACIRKYDGVPYVLYAVAVNGSGTVRIYRNEIEKLDASDALFEDYAWVEENGPVDVLLHPRWKPKAHSSSTLLLTHNPPNPSGTWWGGESHGYLCFNQSGTELRGLRLVEAEGLSEPDGSTASISYVYETVIDVSTPELGFVSGATELLLIDQRLRDTVASDVVLQANGYNVPSTIESGGPPSPGPIPDGTYGYAHTTQWTLATPVTDFTPGGAPQLFDHDYAVKSATVTVTETSNGPIPVAVAYEDDVPVYLYWDPGVATTLYSLSCNYDQQIEYAISGHTETYVGGSLTTEVKTTEGSEVITCVANNTMEASRVGSRLYAVDKNGVTWFERSFDTIATGSVTANLAAEYDGAVTETFISGGGGGFTGSVDGEVNYEASRNQFSHKFYVSIPFLDLASKSIVYYTRETRGTSAADVSFSGGPEGGSMAMPPPATLAYGTNSTSTTTEEIFNTYCIMYGEQVHEDTDSRVTVQSGAATTAPLTGKYINAPYMMFLCNAVINIGLPAVITGDSRIGCLSSSLSFSNFGRGVTGTYSGDWRDAINAVVDPYRTAGATKYPVAADIAGGDALGGLYDYWYMGYNMFIMSGTQRDFSLMGMGGYGSSTDSETQPAPHNTINFRATTDGMGHFITYKGSWAFCIPVFNKEAVFSPFTETWYSRAGHKDSTDQVDLDDITGGRGAEIFGAMWPLSTCLYRFIE